MNYRSAALRGLCYYYFPPCGNETHFEPPNSLCMSICQYLVDDVCQQQWIDALRHFDGISPFLVAYQIDILNCSTLDNVFSRFPHCCSDAGIEEYTTMCKFISTTVMWNSLLVWFKLPMWACSGMLKLSYRLTVCVYNKVLLKGYT